MDRNEKYYRDWDEVVRKNLPELHKENILVPVRNSKGIASMVPPHKVQDIVRSGGRISTADMDKKQMKDFNAIF